MKDIARHIKKGGIAVIPTDTLYGIVGKALSKKTVEKIYTLRKRSPQKPFIILIPSIKSLKKIGVSLTPKQKKVLETVWPNPVSIIFSAPHKKWHYLHRGTKSIAFRIPKNKKLISLLKKTGPLVAPSVNYEGEKPAETIREAKNYFGKNVLYLAGGRLYSKPSTLIHLNKDGTYKVLRRGKLNPTF